MENEDIVSNDENTKNKNEVIKESKSASNAIMGESIIIVFLGFIIFVIYQKLFNYLIAKIVFYFFLILIVLFNLLLISSILDWISAIRIERIEEEIRAEEKEYAGIDISNRALRSEKLYKINQKELMKYYDMNLAQTKFLTGLGIGMILSGVIITIGTIVAYSFLQPDIALLIIGNLTGILLDFMGTIYIKMYTKNLEAAVRFHGKIAESNSLLLANSIANKIENEDLRERTLSDISKEIVRGMKERAYKDDENEK